MARLQNLFSRKKQLYFLHIPKTAGTSVSNSLTEIAVKKNLSMVGPILIDHLVERPHWEKADLLVGHLGLLPLDHNFRYFTVLRDPLERLYSHYSHVKRDPGHYFNKIVTAEKINFEDFLLDERFRNMNFNMQTRYLSTIPKFDHSEKYGAFPQRAYDFENSLPSMISLELAFHTLKNALFVGNQSNLNYLAKFLDHHFRFPNIQFPFLNQNPENSKNFNNREFKAAQPLLELDTAIYQRWYKPIRSQKRYFS
jgi:hypothetical protein